MLAVPSFHIPDSGQLIRPTIYDYRGIAKIEEVTRTIQEVRSWKKAEGTIIRGLYWYERRHETIEAFR